MAVTSTSSANSTPGTVEKEGEVPSNLDAARPVIDRIKDIDLARAEEGGAGSGDAVIDNTPETAAENERLEAEAAQAEKDAKADKAEQKKGSR